MAKQDLAGLSVWALGRLYKAKEVSPVEVVEAYLERIERLDSRVNAFCQVLPEQALAEARRAEADRIVAASRGTSMSVNPVEVADEQLAALLDSIL